MKFVAFERAKQGTGASRRLRITGRTPGIVYGGKGEALDEVVITNTIPLSDGARECKKIRQLSVAPLIAETIQRIAKGESVMSLFSDQDNLF